MTDRVKRDEFLAKHVALVAQRDAIRALRGSSYRRVAATARYLRGSK